MTSCCSNLYMGLCYHEKINEIILIYFLNNKSLISSVHILLTFPNFRFKCVAFQHYQKVSHKTCCLIQGIWENIKYLITYYLITCDEICISNICSICNISIYIQNSKMHKVYLIASEKTHQSVSFSSLIMWSRC